MGFWSLLNMNNYRIPQIDQASGSHEASHPFGRAGVEDPNLMPKVCLLGGAHNFWVGVIRETNSRIPGGNLHAAGGGLASSLRSGAAHFRRIALRAGLQGGGGGFWVGPRHSWGRFRLTSISLLFCFEV